MLARAYGETKDIPSQIRALELVTAKNPKDYVALTELGSSYLKAKRIEDAATAFGAARELNSKYRPAYEGALNLLETTQEIYEARALVADIIKTFGPDAKTTATLCRLSSGEGFVPEKTEDACRRAIAADPKNPENYVFLTYALRDTDQKPQAFTTISSAASRFPASESVQILAGQMKADEKSFGEAYRFYDQAVKANASSARAQVGFAKSAFELQKHGEAIDAFVKACKLDRKTTLDFRQAATTLKKSKDAKWLLYQDAIDNRCND
jgi:tetratricopeptide (TPR) repeat protein